MLAFETTPPQASSCSAAFRFLLAIASPAAVVLATPSMVACSARSEEKQCGQRQAIKEEWKGSKGHLRLPAMMSSTTLRLPLVM